VNLPDITPAQLAAWLATLISVIVVLFKLNMTDAQQGALVTILVAVATAFHFVSDGIIRHGRATGIAVEMEKTTQAVAAAQVERLADGVDSEANIAAAKDPTGGKGHTHS
jgi:hypothetical protein